MKLLLLKKFYFQFSKSKTKPPSEINSQLNDTNTETDDVNIIVSNEGSRKSSQSGHTSNSGVEDHDENNNDIKNNLRRDSGSKNKSDLNYVDDVSDMMRDPSSVDTRPQLPKSLPPGAQTSSSYRADQGSSSSKNNRFLNENSSLTQNKMLNNFNFSESNNSLNNHRMQLPILDINQSSPPTPLKRLNQPSVSSQNNITLSSTSLSNRTPVPPPYKTINDITPSAHEFLNAKNTNQSGSSNLNQSSSRINSPLSYNNSNSNINNSNSNLYSTVFKNNGGNANFNLNKNNNTNQQISSHSNVESRLHDAAAPDANLSRLNAPSNLGTLAGGIKVLPTNKDECNLLFY